jgi:NADH-ubiquinone oxidoreductase chain 3
MSNLFFLFIFVPILGFVLLGLNLLLAPHRPDESKVSAYECGFSPVYGQTRSTFQIHFYLVGMLFLIFDLEILILYPLAVTLYQVSSYGFSIAMLFFFVLTIGFVLEVNSGAISLQNADVKSYNNKNIKLTPYYLICSGNSNYYKNNVYTHVHKNNFSTSIVKFKDKTLDNIDNNALTYWEKVHEKDVDQETNNPHIIARRHITKGTNTDAQIINLVQSKLGLLYNISKEELEILKLIKPISIIFKNIDLHIKVREILRKHLEKNKKIAGVYVWTNLKTGDQNVGSSVNLYTRLRYYFKPSVLNEGNRLINQSMREFGIENFKLDIYIIDTIDMDSSKIRAITLSLEQYYIFVLKPSLNLIKVAGSNPIVNHTEEHIASIKKANSKRVYVYKDKTLVYEANSTTDLVKQINLSYSTVNYSIRNPSKKIFKYFNISRESPTQEIEIKKIEAQTLNDLINEYCPLEQRINKNIKSIIMTSENGDVLSFSSINKARKHFKTRYTNISLYIDQDKPIIIKNIKWLITSKLIPLILQ